MKHVFIVNPAAGRRDLTQAIKDYSAEILGGDAEVLVTNGPGHAAELAKSRAASGEAVRLYACGGDGTANEVLSGMFGYDNAQLALVPIGSGNDFVKMYNPTNDLRTIIHTPENRVKRIDVMSCEYRLALNVVCAGFDANVAARIPKFKRIPGMGGSMAYTMSLLVQFFMPMGIELGFVVDGEELPKGRYLFGVVSNGSYYGGGFKPNPNALLDDGRLNFLRIQKIPRRRFLKLVGEYKKGEHLKYTDFITQHLCTRVQFLCDHAINVNIDGELAVLHNPHIEIKPASLWLVMPG